MIRIFLSLLIFKTFATDLIKASGCVTPYGENATCTPIPDCPVIKSALLTYTPRVIQFVKDSQCGCTGGMVCCGSSSDKLYPQLIDCVPMQTKKISLSDISDRTVCGLDSQTDKIYGGSNAAPEEFPWLAALEYRSKITKESAGIRCGGSIITRRFILTAAHCIENAEFEMIKVWLGVTNLTSEETCSNTNGNIRCIKTVQKLNIAQKFRHEYYHPLYKYNDIGLLRMESDIQFTDYIRPICVPETNSAPPSIGTSMTAAGWGLTENEIPSDVKLKVQVPLRDNHLCQQFLEKRNQNITSSQLCVGGIIGKDACTGDSGGPLMYESIDANGDVQWLQEGIVSYGTGCGVQGRPAIYVNVSSYQKWMLYIINNRYRNSIEEYAACQIHDGSTGSCADANNCPQFFKQIFNKWKYYGYKNEYNKCTLQRKPLVCCPTSSSVIKTDLNTKSVFPNETTCGIVKEEDGTGFPWMAGIEVSTDQVNGTEIRCIGTVIHSRYIFTSVECVFGKWYEAFEPINVLLGRWNISRSNSNATQKIGIKNIFAYPLNVAYTELFHALILLENEIKFSDYINPICLDWLNLPKIKEELLTTLWPPKNSSRLKPIISSDTIMKQDLSFFYCYNGWCPSTDDNCGKQPLLGSPIMRKYQDPVNGKIQWYLVSVETGWEYSCAPNVYYSTIMASLNQIKTIISEHS